MSNNREWMYQRLDRNGFLTDEFARGVVEFLEFAYSHSEIVDYGCIKCPCLKCRNLKFHDRDTVHYHLIRFGFEKGYTIWDNHGEPWRRGPVGETSGSMIDENFGMRDMVLDAAGLNFDWRFARDEHPMETEQSPNSEAQKFFEMLKDAEEPLWHGCTKHTRLSAVSQLLNIKSDFNLPQSCVDRIIALMKSMMPEDAVFPSNLYNAKKMVAKLGLGYEKIDVCVNNCMLYYKEEMHKTKCTICGHERYKPRTVGSRIDVPYKMLRYLSLIPRLQRLYMSKNTSKKMTWHFNNQCEDGSMAHPAHSEAWKHFDRSHPQFASEPRNVRLGLCTDGFTPFNNNGVPYSCWPVMLVVYNFPPGMTMEEPYIFLNMVIPGPKSPGKKLDVFLRPLIDELKLLWCQGVDTYDAFNKQNFLMRAALMWTINDFPAYGMVSNWSTHGKLSCPYCMEHTKAFRLANGRKQSWFDCHRQFLPCDHSYRSQTRQFIRGRREEDTPPPRLSGKEIRRRVFLLPPQSFDQHGNPKDLPGYGETHNWVKISIFWELPYWCTNLIRHNLDVMHIERNVFENVFNTVLDVKRKSKDNGNARRDLELYCDRPELHMFENNRGKLVKPKATYTLSTQQVKEVCTWAKGLKLPDGYASNIARCVNEKESKFYAMKSHDCHVFMQRLLPIAFRDLLPKPVWEAISELSVFFRDICTTVLHVRHMELLEKNIVDIICKLEKIFPPAFFNVMEHLPIHLAYEAKVGGPVQYRWMYPFERFLRRLKQKVKNRAHVEASIVEAYIIEEVATFCSLYFDSNVQTRLNQVPRNDDGGEVESRGRLSIFCHSGRPLGSQRNGRYFLNEAEYWAAHRYVLFNCEEIVPFTTKFDEEISRQHPNLTDEDLGRLRDCKFPRWFQHYVRDPQNMVDENIRCLAEGPSQFLKTYNGYFVNGFKFHTLNYGLHKSTMNSGVCALGSSWSEDEVDYYGLLEEVVELEYFGMGNNIVLFKCHWYDVSNRGVRVNPRFGLVEINHKRKLNTNDPFILAQQAQQVYYSSFPCITRERRDWHAVCKVKARSRIQTPLVARQSQHNLPTADAPFQEDHVAAPFEILLTVDLDYPGILVDDNAAPIEVPIEELRVIQVQSSTQEGEDGDEDEDEEQVEFEEGDTEESESDFEDFDSNSSGNGGDD